MEKNMPFKSALVYASALVLFLCSAGTAHASWKEEKKNRELEAMQKDFEWWPTDAAPGPVKDEGRGGYWWWPTTPGKVRPWGNRGYIYVYKIIFDYKEEELPPPKAQELRPSLLVKSIIKNVKIYFDYDKADLRPDHKPILENAIKVLRQNPDADILITGNCDVRGTEEYNLKLGKARGDAVKAYMSGKGIAESHIRIVSRGKLDAIAPVKDLVGMQKDRNAQFMIAEVEEVMIPYPGEPEDTTARPVEEGKYLIEKEEKVESQIKVTKKEYVVQKDDSLWKIARQHLGSGHRWKYLYEFNKDRIKDPNNLKPGQKLIIPIE